jgi:hypothetical protein
MSPQQAGPLSAGQPDVLWSLESSGDPCCFWFRPRTSIKASPCLEAHYEPEVRVLIWKTLLLRALYLEPSLNLVYSLASEPILAAALWLGLGFHDALSGRDLRTEPTSLFACLPFDLHRGKRCCAENPATSQEKRISGFRSRQADTAQKLRADGPSLLARFWREGGHRSATAITTYAARTFPASPWYDFNFLDEEEAGRETERCGRD